ncbi:MAG TPA: EpsI family protein [Terriglobales bacterium]|nr:EpsI family protein [Terriglobales bacterium]
MALRTGIVALILLAGIFATRNTRPREATLPSRPLREFPSKIGLLHSEERPFESDIVREIGADAYINRIYLGSAPPIELYIAYYLDQRSGDKIHSPKNCLPGSGWEPIHSSNVEIGSVRGVPVLASGYLVAQGTSRYMVLYWYQSHGRIIASEYQAKFWMVADALQNKATDGAMIRIWTNANDGEISAQARAAEFAHRVYPQVAEFLPN